MRTYTAIVKKDESGAYLAVVPALPACYAQGDTYEEALANIREVIELVLEDLAETGEAIPQEVGSERIAVA